jgi:ssDNA-binding Zn-finger/Zn-ribbon topoisomerase 1
MKTPDKKHKPKILNSEKAGMRITIRIGHLCPKCGTKMVLFRPKVNPMQLFKDEIYEIHQYK